MARPPPLPWRIIPRPLLETILNNYAHHHRVPQPLLLHGPRGSGKSSLLVHRLLPQWSQPPHFTSFVDFSPLSPPPWSLSSPSSSPPSFADLKDDLESALEALTLTAIKMGAISSANIFKTLSKHYGMSTALRRITGGGKLQLRSESRVWSKAVFDRAALVGVEEGGDEVGVVKEGMAALRVAKEVVEMGKEWRREAVRGMHRDGRFAKSLVDSATDWPVLLVELLSQAAEVDFFQVVKHF